jgi:hypothetical protein
LDLLSLVIEKAKKANISWSSVILQIKPRLVRTAPTATLAIAG